MKVPCPHCGSPMETDTVIVDCQKRRIRFGAAAIKLQPVQAAILAQLHSAPGVTFPPSALSAAVQTRLNRKRGVGISNNAIRVHIFNLRRIVSENNLPFAIEAVAKAGYCYVPKGFQ